MTTDRSAADDHRISLHECGHALTGRVLSFALAGVTCDPRDGYSGLCWGPSYSSKFADDNGASIVEQLNTALPRDGEPHDESAMQIIAHCRMRIIELCAGSEAELLHLGDAWPAVSDRAEEIHLARLVCSTEESALAFISACAAEARAILRRYKHVLIALTDELLAKRTMTGEEVDRVIATALAQKSIRQERERREDWKQRQANAQDWHHLVVDES
jgi:hypothetical protein